jgi:ADP-ribosylglycohydrolase
MSDTTTEDRCRGVLMGLAAGDRNGGPIRMAVRLAESLLDCGFFKPMDILNRYLAWWREGAFDTGPVSERVFALMAAGMRVTEATAQVHREFDGKTAGCNPAHRSSPLSMLASIADQELAACPSVSWPLAHILLPQRKSEVGHERPAALVEEDVAGLDVPMHQTLFVGVVQGFGDGRQQFDGFVDG